VLLYQNEYGDYLSVPTKFQPGETVWVRETWASNIAGCLNGITYKADHIDPRGDGPTNPIKWKSPMFMPFRAARLFLTITNETIERLNSITEADAIAEGVQSVEEYAALWNKINPKTPFAYNPWVRKITFEVKEVK
jgi:hypothetical protein